MFITVSHILPRHFRRSSPFPIYVNGGTKQQYARNKYHYPQNWKLFGFLRVNVQFFFYNCFGSSTIFINFCSNSSCFLNP